MNLASWIALIFILSSCSQLTQRSPSQTLEVNQELALAKWFDESVQYILSYASTTYGSFESLRQDEQKLYRFIGKIDLNKIDTIQSRIISNDPAYASLLNFSLAKQVDYETWIELKDEVVANYLTGNYIFKRGNHFYSLSGIKFDISVISSELRTKLKKNYPSLSMDKFALSLFNKNLYLPLSDRAGLTLPFGDYIQLSSLFPLMNDFKEQVRIENNFSLEELLNYNYKKSHLKLGKLQDYFALKYKSFLKNFSIKDSNQACQTLFYHPSLSRRTEVKIFIDTLLKHKSNLMSELNLTNNEYNELMVLALGILNVETKMGTSIKYFIKEDLRVGNLNLGQLAIQLAKKLIGRDESNSRGLTQIKDIGPRVEDTEYQYLEHSSLDNPEHAALATMFVLKEKLGYLLHYKNRHPAITDSNWADYLYYFYQGASSQITKGLATPPRNLRIKKILEVRENTILFNYCD
jgi:hypothetical protein